MHVSANVTSPEEILAYVQEICNQYKRETLQSVASTVKSLHEEFEKMTQSIRESSIFKDTRTEEEKKIEQDEWRYRDYLGILTQLHQAGHNVHDELNETLKRLQKLMFR